MGLGWDWVGNLCVGLFYEHHFAMLINIIIDHMLSFEHSGRGAAIKFFQLILGFCPKVCNLPFLAEDISSFNMNLHLRVTFSLRSD